MSPKFWIRNSECSAKAKYAADLTMKNFFCLEQAMSNLIDK